MQLFCDDQIVYVGPDQAQLNSYECAVGWATMPTTQFDVSNLDPVLIAGAVGAGFFCLVPLWFAVFGLRALLRAIR